VKTQIWIAVSVYVLVAILRKRLSLEPPLYTLLQVISVTVFEKSRYRRHFLNKPTDTILHKMITNWICLAFNPTLVSQNNKMSVLAVVDGPDGVVCNALALCTNPRGFFSGQLFTRTAATERHLCLSLRVSQAIIIARRRPAHPAVADRPSELSRKRMRLANSRAEFQAPPPDRLVCDRDAACRQHLLDHAQASTGTGNTARPRSLCARLGSDSLHKAGAASLRHPRQISPGRPGSAKTGSAQVDGAPCATRRAGLISVWLASWPGYEKMRSSWTRWKNGTASLSEVLRHSLHVTPILQPPLCLGPVCPPQPSVVSPHGFLGALLSNRQIIAQIVDNHSLRSIYPDSKIRGSVGFLPLYAGV